MPLARRQPFANRVQRPVRFRVRRQKMFVSFAALPHVHGHITQRLGKIAQQASLAEVRGAAEQARPLPGAAVRKSKPDLALPLDIELPEDYKHRCPISCSWTHATLLENLREWLRRPAECSNPSGYILRRGAVSSPEFLCEFSRNFSVSRGFPLSRGVTVLA
jgi:hypothetical protein